MSYHGHIGPHVPCIQRAFLVLSIIAIFLGLGAIAGGVLLILYMTGVTAIASGAVVILVGVILVIVPPILSFKVFHLRVKRYEGSPRIVKSYGEFPNDLSYPTNRNNLNIYNISESGSTNVPGSNGQSSSPVRTAYLPGGKTNNGLQLDFEEESTSFATNAQTKNEIAAKQQNPYYNVRARVADPKNETSQASVTSQSNNSQSEPLKTKPPINEQRLVYHSSMPKNDAKPPANINRPKPPRNVSSLYPDTSTRI